MVLSESRVSIPAPAFLGLKGDRAAEDIKRLGWDNEESFDVLWALAGSGDPDQALNILVRLIPVLEERGEATQFQKMLRENHAFRVRLMALAGGSVALGDDLVAHPDSWRELVEDLPSRMDMMRGLLGVLDAVPALSEEYEGRQDPARMDLSEAGTYRARLSDVQAQRRLKERYRLFLMRIAAHDLAGTYPSTKRHRGLAPVPFDRVTRLLSDLADAALTASLAIAVENVYGNSPIDGRIAVVALGKCGARELNYISDVDVMFVVSEVTPRITRLAGECARIGSQNFFEVDANLRPEGRSGALVRTVDSYRTYYLRWAETWEFQALLKSRPQTGYLPLGEEYCETLLPLVWGASQRESFVEDIQAMRRRVLDNVPAAMRERELKLGRGGLRDVEFAVQLLQLVHGRSDESLRVSATVSALRALMEAGTIGREDGQGLIQAYEFLRLLEHRLQLYRLRRTHSLPEENDYPALTRLALTSGYGASDGKSSLDNLRITLRRVRFLISELHSKLFYRPLLNSVVNMSVDTLKLSPGAAKLQLAALGYRFPDRAFEHLMALASGSSRKSKIQAMLLPTLMDWLSQTADPDAGLLNYRKLSDAAYERSWFLRLLRDEGVVGQRLMAILGSSPYTADLIISSPDFVKVLGDGASGPKILDKAPGTVSSSLVAAAGRHRDPDKAIAIARGLRRTELARLASADLLGMMDVRAVCRGLSMVWNAVLEAALQAEIRSRLPLDEGGESRGVEGAPARIAVIGMGRLGGAELGFGSDADVMFVAEPQAGHDEHEALRWAATVCESLRSRLAKPSGDPPLEVDLGLRPEGRSGAVVRSIASYRRYYSSWGEVWETQALLRATVVAGDREVGIEFLRMIDEFRYPRDGMSATAIREVRRMKARVDEERLPRGADRNTHTKLGRGALTDIEWTVQLLIMMHAHEYPALHNTSTLEVLDVLEAESIVPAEQVRVLREAWLEATNVRNALVLVRGKRTDQIPEPGPQLAQVAGAAGWDPAQYQAFLEDYLRKTRRARRVVDQVFWGESTIR
ncbi:bifunctional [glutamine synthetase] adenylyltransferase/[glutamine synthetase]-adenylyl-L-tyrosine phosphorylase [Corynebacterium sp. zg-331]|uniref:bifunctional [glutamine synthetase] adenylyltransferase/[glutamine synthetase]-adenylyl-L-tyrosine phosphorylase n=1 Tax=unclassified Corynebacterium TaxID=2624378 RepID=UPI00128C61AC|nr:MULTISPECIES: bifunctional [glutamine synthetase] adenylyltransferase/[glutamine synthetase]-adenylyl-L-tyrosine phosphorylase [unclassified Corynebacterium]MBC3185162.1 bifunctional [glutamine synthetase] adenylyltransferase/[glutamine synthetase]-adenylyl-L-tyrosine phosphorylase [Corynebacterium sp. zg-331]MPV51660.1 bifunctional [glutamine synthetase] adenylyltransferase/[glutamine synthetase]-adenylyl-L-tyrosine phosphorylase [Corynebacterium sp. zg331]